jgi:hypothetical protein
MARAWPPRSSLPQRVLPVVVPWLLHHGNPARKLPIIHKLEPMKSLAQCNPGGALVLAA